MRIHLAKSGGDNLPNGEDFRVILAEELYQNSLFSYAFKDHQHRWEQYWNKLINHVENTRNK